MTLFLLNTTLKVSLIVVVAFAAGAALLGGEGSKLSDEQLDRIADLLKKSRTKR